MKKRIVLFLALVLLLGCAGAAAFADAPAASPTPIPSALNTPPEVKIPEGADEQISLIFSKFDTLRQSDDSVRWSYAVTDLDHNDRLELLAAAIQGEGRFTTVKAWQVSADRQSLDELRVPLKDGDSFPDVITDAADTFHDKDSGFWYYMINDQITVSTKEVYANKSAIALVQDELQFATYAFQHNEWLDGRMVTTFTNQKGEIITPEEYNGVGNSVFGHMERSSTAFDWFLAADAAVSGRFTDSYAVFLGLRQPPKPETPAPVMTPRPDTYSAFLMITKNPTGEYRSAGDTAWFQANAENWSTATWTFVDPYNNECSWQSFNNRFPNSSVSGGDSPSVSISNADTGMNGWGAYCTFYGNGQTARSTTAYFNIQARPQPTPTYGQMDGYVSDYGTRTVTIALNNGSSVQLQRDICQIDGSLDIGDSATVYYYNYPSRENIYSCYIRGSQDPDPGQMGGYVSNYGMSTITVALDNGDEVSIPREICQMDGDIDYGSLATVYYNGYPSRDTIYYCYIQGSYNPDPDPGQMGATFTGATMSGDNFALDNGDYVTVAFGLCSSYGNVTYGDSATVYYYGYPSADTIYHVDIYGSADDPDDPIWIDPVLPPEPDDPWVGPIIGPEPDDPDDSGFGPWIGPDSSDFDGGWAGSNYPDDDGDVELID